MAQYIFPAVLTPEENGAFSVTFPDITGCVTCGDNLNDALSMAKDALELMLVQYEDEHREIPNPSAIPDIKAEGDAFPTLINADTTVYRRTLNNAAVKKTLSIPAWLNDAAIAAGINFSQTLQDALKKELSL